MLCRKHAGTFSLPHPAANLVLTVSFDMKLKCIIYFLRQFASGALQQKRCKLYVKALKSTSPAQWIISLSGPDI